MRLGKFFGVGVGPGDPELLTLKALRVLLAVDYLFVASSSKNDYSRALEVIKPHLLKPKPIENLPFPMTYDQGVLLQAWKANAARVAEELCQGKDVAFITLGDPCFYSTLIYLVRELKELLPKVKIEIVPGITAAQAAAARFKVALSEGESSVLFASGTKGKEIIHRLGKKVDVLVLYKVYRQASDILKALEDIGRLQETKGISFCGLPEEKIYQNVSSISGSRFPYLTLFIVGGKDLA